MCHWNREGTFDSLTVHANLTGPRYFDNGAIRSLLVLILCQGQRLVADDYRGLAHCAERSFCNC